MNSFNHYAFGAVGEWMYRTIGGIDLDSAGAGYRRARIAPRIGGGLTSARAWLQTPYGRLASDWRLEGERLVLEVTIPANTSAEVVLRDSDVGRVRESSRPLGGTPGIRSVAQLGKDVVLTIGSGTYRFTTPP